MFQQNATSAASIFGIWGSSSSQEDFCDQEFIKLLGGEVYLGRTGISSWNNQWRKKK